MLWTSAAVETTGWIHTQQRQCGGESADVTGGLAMAMVSHWGVTVGAGKAQHSGAAGGFFRGWPPSPSATRWHRAWENNPPGHRESRDWRLKEDEGVGAPLFVVAVSTAQRGQDGGTQAAQWGVGPRKTTACDQTRMARPGFGCHQRGGAGKDGAAASVTCGVNGDVTRVHSTPPHSARLIAEACQQWETGIGIGPD